MVFLNIIKMISKYNFYVGNISRIKYIVIHYAGCVAPAKNFCNNCMKGNIGKSAHYFIDYNGDIYQSVEDKNSAWHCGSKTGYKHKECRNSNSIGIELCCRTTGNPNKADSNWYFEDATVKAAIALVKELMAKYNIPVDHVIRHYDVTGKICPAPYYYNNGKHTWDQFKTAITNQEQIPVEIQNQTSPIKGTSLDPFRVRVSIIDLNIRKGPGTNYAKFKDSIKPGIYTIVEVSKGKGSKAGWGLLKTYQKTRDHWISLDFVSKI